VRQRSGNHRGATAVPEDVRTLAMVAMPVFVGLLVGLQAAAPMRTHLEMRA
jgi:hypothetical protein